MNATNLILARWYCQVRPCASPKPNPSRIPGFPAARRGCFHGLSEPLRRSVRDHAWLQYRRIHTYPIVRHPIWSIFSDVDKINYFRRLGSEWRNIFVRSQ
jgi:hypothetical protein